MLPPKKKVKKEKYTFEPVIKGKEETGRTYDESIHKLVVEEQVLSQMEYRKNQALNSYGILNDLNIDDSPKKLIYSDGDIYAFVWDMNAGPSNGYGLWVKSADSFDEDWCEVSDMNDVAVFTYRKLREIAIAIGWIRNSNDDWLI